MDRMRNSFFISFLQVKDIDMREQTRNVMSALDQYLFDAGGGGEGTPDPEPAADRHLDTDGSETSPHSARVYFFFLFFFYFPPLSFGFLLCALGQKEMNYNL